MNISNEELLEQFFKFEGLLRRYQSYRFNSHGPVANPHRGQGRILAILKLQPEISQKELSYLLDMRNQSLSEMLSKLEQKGFITRTPSDQDRRVLKISLTPAGEAAASESADKQSDVDCLFTSFTDEEKEILNGYLKRLMKNAAEQLSQSDTGDYTFRHPFAGGFPSDGHGPEHGPHDGMRSGMRGGMRGDMNREIHGGHFGAHNVQKPEEDSQ